MPLPGSDYFLALAQISIAFVAFSTIVVVLRQAMGGPLSAFQTLLVRYSIECGFAATTFSLGAVLLGLTGLSEPHLWRVSSGLLGLYIVAYSFHYVRRRRRVMPGRLPPRFVVLGIISLVVAVSLGLNALTSVFHASPGPFAIAVTWVLVQAAVTFLLTFGEFLKGASPQ